MIKLEKTTIYIFLIFIGIVLYIIINNNIEKFTLYNCGCDDDDDDNGCQYVKWEDESEILMDHMPGVRHYLFEGVPEYIMNQAQNILSSSGSSWQEVGAYSQENLTEMPRRQIWISQYRDINTPLPEAERRLGQYPFLFDDRVLEILEKNTILNNEIKRRNQIGYPGGPYAPQLELLEKKELIIAEAQRRINVNYRNGGINAARQTQLDQLFIKIYPPPESNFTFNNNNDINYENLWEIKTEHNWSTRHCSNNPVFRYLLPSASFSDTEIDALHDSFNQNASSLSVDANELRADLADMSLQQLKERVMSVGAEAARTLPFDDIGMRAEEAQRQHAVNQLDDMPTEDDQGRPTGHRMAKRAAFNMIFSYMQVIKNASNASENVGAPCSSDDHCHFNNECVNSQCKTRIGESTTMQADVGASVAERQYAMCGVELNNVCLDNPQLGLGYINYHNNNSNYIHGINDSNFDRYNASCSKFTNRYQCLGGNNLMRGGIPSRDIPNYSLNHNIDPYVLGNTCALKCINASHIYCDENNVQSFNWKPNGDLDPDEPCNCIEGYISTQELLFEGVPEYIINRAQERIDIIMSGANLCEESSAITPPVNWRDLPPPDWTRPDRFEADSDDTLWVSLHDSWTRPQQTNESFIDIGLCREWPPIRPIIKLYDLQDKYEADYILRYHVDESILDIADKILLYDPTIKLKDMKYPHCNKQLFVKDNIQSKVKVHPDGTYNEESIICKPGYISTKNNNGELVKCNTINRTSDTKMTCVNDMYSTISGCREFNEPLKRRIQDTPLTLFHIFISSNKIAENNYFLIRNYTKYDPLKRKMENYPHKAMYKISQLKNKAIEFYNKYKDDVSPIMEKGNDSSNSVFNSIKIHMDSEKYSIINDKLIHFIMFLIKCHEVIIKNNNKSAKGGYSINNSSSLFDTMMEIEDPSINNEFNQYYDNDIYNHILLEKLGLNPLKDHIEADDSSSSIRLDLGTLISQHPEIFYLAAPQIQEILNTFLDGLTSTRFSLDRTELLRRVALYIVEKRKGMSLFRSGQSLLMGNSVDDPGLSEELLGDSGLNDRESASILKDGFNDVQEKIDDVESRLGSQQTTTRDLRSNLGDLTSQLTDAESYSNISDFFESDTPLESDTLLKSHEDFTGIFTAAKEQLLVVSTDSTDEGQTLRELNLESEIENMQQSARKIARLIGKSENTAGVTALECFQDSVNRFYNNDTVFNSDILKREWKEYCDKFLEAKYSEESALGDVSARRAYFFEELDGDFIKGIAKKMQNDYVVKMYLWLGGDTSGETLDRMIQDHGLLDIDQIAILRGLSESDIAAFPKATDDGLEILKDLGIVDPDSLRENMIQSMKSTDKLESIERGLEEDYFSRCNIVSPLGVPEVEFVQNSGRKGRQLDFLGVLDGGQIVRDVGANTTVAKPDPTPKIPRLMLNDVAEGTEQGATVGENVILQNAKQRIEELEGRIEGTPETDSSIDILRQQLKKMKKDIPWTIDIVRPLPEARPSLSFADVEYQPEARKFLSPQQIYKRYQAILGEPDVESDIKAFTKLFKEMQQLHFTGGFLDGPVSQTPCQISLTVPSEYHSLVQRRAPSIPSEFRMDGPKFKFSTNKAASLTGRTDEMGTIFEIRDKILSKIETKMLKEVAYDRGVSYEEWRLNLMTPSERMSVRNRMAKLSETQLSQLINKGDKLFMDEIEKALFINPYAPQCYYLDGDLEGIAERMMVQEIKSMEDRVKELQRIQNSATGQLSSAWQKFQELRGEPLDADEIAEYQRLIDSLKGPMTTPPTITDERRAAIENYKESLRRQQVTEYRRVMKKTTLDTADKFKEQIEPFLDADPGVNPGAPGEELSTARLRPKTMKALFEDTKIEELERVVDTDSLNAIDNVLKAAKREELGLKNQIAKEAEERLAFARDITGTAREGDGVGTLRVASRFDQANWKLRGRIEASADGSNDIVTSNWQLKLRPTTDLNPNELMNELDAISQNSEGSDDLLRVRGTLAEWLEEQGMRARVETALPEELTAIRVELLNRLTEYGDMAREDNPFVAGGGHPWRPRINLADNVWEPRPEFWDKAQGQWSKYVDSEYRSDFTIDLGQLDEQVRIQEADQDEFTRGIVRDHNGQNPTSSQLSDLRTKARKKVERLKKAKKLDTTTETIENFEAKYTKLKDSIVEYNKMVAEIKSRFSGDYTMDQLMNFVDHDPGLRDQVSLAKEKIFQSRRELYEGFNDLKGDELFQGFKTKFDLDQLGMDLRMDAGMDTDMAALRSSDPGAETRLNNILDQRMIRQIEQIDKEFEQKLNIQLRPSKIAGQLAKFRIDPETGFAIADDSANQAVRLNLEVFSTMEDFGTCVDTTREYLDLVRVVAGGSPLMKMEQMVDAVTGEIRMETVAHFNHDQGALDEDIGRTVATDNFWLEGVQPGDSIIEDLENIDEKIQRTLRMRKLEYITTFKDKFEAKVDDVAQKIYDQYIAIENNYREGQGLPPLPDDVKIKDMLEREGNNPITEAATKMRGYDEYDRELLSKMKLSMSDLAELDEGGIDAVLAERTPDPSGIPLSEDDAIVWDEEIQAYVDHINSTAIGQIDIALVSELPQSDYTMIYQIKEKLESGELSAPEALEKAQDIMDTSSMDSVSKQVVLDGLQYSGIEDVRGMVEDVILEDVTIDTDATIDAVDKRIHGTEPTQINAVEAEKIREMWDQMQGYKREAEEMMSQHLPYTEGLLNKLTLSIYDLSLLTREELSDNLEFALDEDVISVQESYEIELLWKQSTIQRSQVTDHSVDDIDAYIRELKEDGRIDLSGEGDEMGEEEEALREMWEKERPRVLATRDCQAALQTVSDMKTKVDDLLSEKVDEIYERMAEEGSVDDGPFMLSETLQSAKKTFKILAAIKQRSARDEQTLKDYRYLEDDEDMTALDDPERWEEFLEQMKEDEEVMSGNPIRAVNEYFHKMETLHVEARDGLTDELNEEVAKLNLHKDLTDLAQTLFKDSSGEARDTKIANLKRLIDDLNEKIDGSVQDEEVLEGEMGSVTKKVANKKLQDAWMKFRKDVSEAVQEKFDSFDIDYAERRHRLPELDNLLTSTEATTDWISVTEANGLPQGKMPVNYYHTEVGGEEGGNYGVDLLDSEGARLLDSEGQPIMLGNNIQEVDTYRGEEAPRLTPRTSGEVPVGRMTIVRNANEELMKLDNVILEGHISGLDKEILHYKGEMQEIEHDVRGERLSLEQLEERLLSQRDAYKVFIDETESFIELADSQTESVILYSLSERPSMHGKEQGNLLAEDAGDAEGLDLTDYIAQQEALAQEQEALAEEYERMAKGIDDMRADIRTVENDIRELKGLSEYKVVEARINILTKEKEAFQVALDLKQWRVNYSQMLTGIDDRIKSITGQGDLTRMQPGLLNINRKSIHELLKCREKFLHQRPEFERDLRKVYNRKIEEARKKYGESSKGDAEVAKVQAEREEMLNTLKAIKKDEELAEEIWTLERKAAQRFLRAVRSQRARISPEEILEGEAIPGWKPWKIRSMTKMLLSDWKTYKKFMRWSVKTCIEFYIWGVVIDYIIDEYINRDLLDARDEVCGTWGHEVGEGLGAIADAAEHRMIGWGQGPGAEGSEYDSVSDCRDNFVEQYRYNCSTKDIKTDKDMNTDLLFYMKKNVAESILDKTYTGNTSNIFLKDYIPLISYKHSRLFKENYDSQTNSKAFLTEWSQSGVLSASANCEYNEYNNKYIDSCLNEREFYHFIDDSVAKHVGPDKMKEYIDNHIANNNIQQKILDTNAVTIYKPLSEYEIADFTLRLNNYWQNYNELKDGTYEYKTQINWDDHESFSGELTRSGIDRDICVGDLRDRERIGGEWEDGRCNIIDHERDNWSTKVAIAVAPYNRPDNWDDLPEINISGMTNASKIENVYINNLINPYAAICNKNPDQERTPRVDDGAMHLRATDDITRNLYAYLDSNIDSTVNIYESFYSESAKNTYSFNQ